jgi:hypothetical protein
LKNHLFVLAAGFSLLASSPQIGWAQDAPPAQAEQTRNALAPDEVVSTLDGKLSLSDDQKAKITPIIVERQQKIRELADSSGRRMKKGRQMKSILEESDKKIMAVLNDEQKEKYKEIQKQMRDRAKRRRHDRENNTSSQ